MARKDSGELGVGGNYSMDTSTKNTGSLADGVVVATLLAMTFATAFAFMDNSHSEQYRDRIAKSDVTSDECRLLFPAQQ